MAAPTLENVYIPNPIPDPNLNQPSAPHQLHSMLMSNVLHISSFNRRIRFQCSYFRSRSEREPDGPNAAYPLTAGAVSRRSPLNLAESGTRWQHTVLLAQSHNRTLWITVPSGSRNAWQALSVGALTRPSILYHVKRVASSCPGAPPSTRSHDGYSERGAKLPHSAGDLCSRGGMVGLGSVSSQVRR